MDVDDIDRRIVNALLADGRAGPRDVSAETGIAATTVQRRLEDLEAAGVVDGYTATVDYEALGYDVTAIFHLSVDGDGRAGLIERLRDHDRMVSVYEVTGDHDVVAVGKFTDTEEMNARIKDLLTDPDVQAANTSVVLNTVREFGTFPVDLAET